MTNQDIFIDHRENDYSASALLCALRHSRDLKIAKTDWTQLPDAQLTDSKKAEWVTYRQELRDLPANTSDPANPTWPTKPS